ncbi:hypothetical protein [Methanolobus halotolerans]|uniref:Uncharacterized protein n=1 Tax=Methanolobus halotolerans TaxID=2052935 RepID=A0A4E0Q4C5_9EURY|nr:hypothetical protein [Methanolobus halotolerans]TGC08710.1 hypothetical protein CUN85_08515 [Methanolobus halotolerans]
MGVELRDRKYPGFLKRGTSRIDGLSASASFELTLPIKSINRGDHIRSIDTMEKRNRLEYENPASYDEDAEFKPMLQSVINTRCNYDGGKIEGTLEV